MNKAQQSKYSSTSLYPDITQMGVAAGRRHEPPFFEFLARTTSGPLLLKELVSSWELMNKKRPLKESKRTIDANCGKKGK